MISLQKTGTAFSFFLLAVLFTDLSAQDKGTKGQAASTNTQTVVSSASDTVSVQRYNSVGVVKYTSMDDASKNPDEVYKLDLSGQELTSVPAGISKFRNLVLLNLSNNQISEVPAELFSLTGLLELNLGNNKLTSVPAQICSLKNLQSVYFNGNKITTLGTEVYCLAGLQKLFLQNNAITAVPPGIANLKELRYLYLFGNLISKVPDELSGMSKLQALLLNNNKLKEAPAGLEKLKTLKYYSDLDNPFHEESFRNAVSNGTYYSSANRGYNTYSGDGAAHSDGHEDSYSGESSMQVISSEVQEGPATSRTGSYSSPNYGIKKKTTAGKVLRAFLIYELVAVFLIVPVIFLV